MTQSLIERSIQEAELWLDRIQPIAREGKLDASKVAALVAPWGRVIEVARTAFGLGDNDRPFAVRIGVLNQAHVRLADTPHPPGTELALPLAVGEPLPPIDVVADAQTSQAAENAVHSPS
jgi:hypothetical protein